MRRARVRLRERLEVDHRLRRLRTRTGGVRGSQQGGQGYGRHRPATSAIGFLCVLCFLNESEGGSAAAHTLFGFSRGRWEGATLVVETDHIAAGYFDHEGTPQSDQISYECLDRFEPGK